MSETKAKSSGVWGWIGTLYFMEGLPNAIVMTLAVSFYFTMGLSNAEMARLTTYLYLPWVLKALWSPLVEALGTRRSWILFCCGLFAAVFTLLALAPLAEFWIFTSVAAFFVLAVLSATFDIAADGFYMAALDERQQAFFVGIRNSFYRLALLFAQGGLLVLVGKMQKNFGVVAESWSVGFGLCALFALCAFAYLRLALPRPKEDKNAHTDSVRALLKKMLSAFVSFFKKPQIVYILIFILFYRFAEAQLVKMVQPFLLDGREAGGLAFAMEEVGLIYGTSAPIALFAGGILGGIFISKVGLKRALWPMALALNAPNLIYVYLAFSQLQSVWGTGALIFLEQFGYGFGFAGYMMFLIHVAKGLNKTSHYAICTGFMALGMAMPGYISGDIQMALGYFDFFVWIAFSTAVSFAATFFGYLTIARK